MITQPLCIFPHQLCHSTSKKAQKAAMVSGAATLKAGDTPTTLKLVML